MEDQTDMAHKIRYLTNVNTRNRIVRGFISAGGDFWWTMHSEQFFKKEKYDRNGKIYYMKKFVVPENSLCQP